MSGHIFKFQEIYSIKILSLIKSKWEKNMKLDRLESDRVREEFAEVKNVFKIYCK